MEIHVRRTPLVGREGRSLWQVYEVDVVNDGPKQWAALSWGWDDGSDGWAETLAVLADNGVSRHRLKLPWRTESRPARVRLAWEGGSRERGEAVERFRHVPVRPWEVYVVCHSHTDVGFTHKVSDVARIHNKNLDRAIEYCEATEGWEEGSRFAWVIEVSWQLQNYLRDRHQGWVERLRRQLAAGRMEIAPFYAGHYFDLLGHEQLVESLRWGIRMGERFGVPVKTAMVIDLPGSTWALPQVLAGSGVENLVAAPNNFNAPFMKWTELPRPFYWEAPDKSRVLVWYTDDPYWSYIEGIKYGLWAGVDQVEKKLSEKLLELEAEGYPYDLLHLQTASDNILLRLTPATIARQWNARWAFPRLKLATSTEFFTEMRRRYGERFETFRGDWPHSWSAVPLGYPYEAAQSRRDHDRLATAERIAAVADFYSPTFSYPTETIEEAYDALLMVDEHSGTKGIWRPRSAREQREAHEEGFEFVERSHRLVGEALDGALLAATEAVEAFDGPALVVWNLLGWNRSGWVRVDRAVEGDEPWPQDESGWRRFRLVDEEGREVPFWCDPGPVFYAHDVPAMGYKRYVLREREQEDGATQVAEQEATRVPAPPDFPGAQVRADERLLESEHYALAVSADGRVVSLVDKATGVDLVDLAEARPTGAEACATATAGGRSGDDAHLGGDGPGYPAPDLGGLVRYWVEPRGPGAGGDFTAATELYEGVPAKGRIASDARKDVAVQPYVRHDEAGFYIRYQEGDTYRVERWVGIGRAEKQVRFRLRVTPLDGAPRGELLYAYFPWSLRDPEIVHERPGGTARPGVDNLSGSWMDFFAVSHYSHLKSPAVDVVAASLDAALVDYGRVRAGSFARTVDVPRGHVAYRLFNGGPPPSPERREEDPWAHGTPATFEWVVTSGRDVSRWEAARFGWEAAHSLLGVVRPKGRGDGLGWPSWSLCAPQGEGVAVLSVKRADRGYLVRLWEMTGQARTVRLEFGQVTLVACAETDLYGRGARPLAVEANGVELAFRPHEYKTLQVVLGH